MRKWTWTLSVVLAFSLAACKEKEKLCEPSNLHCEEGEALCKEAEERCKVGEGKCVVGYDGDCERGQVCYAGEGAPKGKPGTCTDGEFDAEGKLIATVVSSGLFQGNRIIGVHARTEQPSMPSCPWRYRECFGGCLVPTLAVGPTAPDWIGRGAATMTVKVQGPHAEAAQLKAAVRGAAHEGCEKTGSPSQGRQQWTCRFPEGWAGLNTTESLALKLWTENIQACPWGGGFLVDTQPLELALEAQVKEGFLEASINKPGALGWQEEQVWPWGTTDRAWLREVHYSSLRVFRNGHEIPMAWEPVTRMYGFSWEQWEFPPGADPRIELPADLNPGDTLEVRATVNAKDLADNEVSMQELTTTLKP